MPPARRVGALRRLVGRWIIGVDPAPVVDWVAGAEKHLAALQAAFERLDGRVARLEAGLTSTPHGDVLDRDETAPLLQSHDPVLAWIRGAERHLAALQSETERLATAARQHGDQTARLIARLSLLGDRLGDLERADTSLAEAIAHDRLHKSE